MSEVNIGMVGDGKVYLLAGGGKIFSEMVVKFCRSERGVEEIAASPYVKELLKNIIKSGHKAALEFDDYIFGIEGFSRVTEIQLARKRHQSLMIKSGRVNKHGKRKFDVVLPRSVCNVIAPVELVDIDGNDVTVDIDAVTIMNIINQWYDQGVADNIPEEDLRFVKPQATEFKGAIKMNASALSDFFQRRLCRRAQSEIRDLAIKMYKECMKVHPDIFEEMGPPCRVNGFCTEMEQCSTFKGIIPTRDEALTILKANYNKDRLMTSFIEDE